MSGWLDDSQPSSQSEEGTYSVARSSTGGDVTLNFSHFTGTLKVTSSGALINVFDANGSAVAAKRMAAAVESPAPARPSDPPLKRSRKSKADKASEAPALRLSLTPSPPSSGSAQDGATTMTIAAAVEGSPPPARWAHSTTLIAPDKIMVYGGESEAPHMTLCDVHILNVRGGAEGGARWEHPASCDGAPRAWHTATFVPAVNAVIVFGGQFVSATGGEVECVADIQVFDPELLIWYPPKINGVSPSARSGHTASLLGAEVVVFGGCRGRKWCGDLWALNTATWRWRRPNVSGRAPSPRSYCSANAVESGCVFFGGNDRDNTLNDVILLDTAVPGQWRWERPCVVGVPPGVRTGHSTSALASDALIVFGGWDPNPGRAEDEDQPDDDSVVVYRNAFRLDTEQWTWAPIEIQPSGCVGARWRGLLSVRLIVVAGPELRVRADSSPLPQRASSSLASLSLHLSLSLSLSLPSSAELAKGIVGHRAAVVPTRSDGAEAAAAAAQPGPAASIFCFGGQFLSSERSAEACFFDVARA
jgi:hypothetical protein